MTHFKKSLALLLAFVMIFSSMSVAASAFDPTTEGGFDINFKTEFYRMVEDENGDAEWILTDRVAPGEKVKARVYIGTDYYTYSGNIALLFDSRFMQTTLEDGVSSSLLTNVDYMDGSVRVKSDNAVYREDETLLGQNSNNKLVTKGIISDEFFDDLDIVSNSYNITTGYTTILDGSEWVIEYDFVVRDEDQVAISDSDFAALVEEALEADYDGNYDALTDEQKETVRKFAAKKDYIITTDENGKVVAKTDCTTRVVGSTGKAYVPDEQLAASPTNGYRMFINLPKAEKAGRYLDIPTYSMATWVADITTVDGEITTTSNVVLDGNGGTFSENGSDYTSINLPGIIGDKFDTADLSEDKQPVRADYAFSGWSEIPVPADRAMTAEVMEALGLTQEDADAQGNVLSEDQVKALTLSQAEIADIVYDYSDKTLYAVWTATEASDNYYTYQVFYMNTDGTYPTTANYSQQILAETGLKVDLPKTPVEGFYIDTDNSDSTITVKGDKSSVLNAYYARNKYTVTYSYSDNSGTTQIQEHTDVYYGADVPEFDGLEFPLGVPVKEGYTFTGWKTKDGKDGPSTMPNSDVEFFAQYEANKYTLVFDATQGGKFESNGQRTVSFVYEYGETPDAFDEIPVYPGMEFLGWDNEMPDVVTEDIIFTAEYSDIEYTVKFVDGDETLDEILYYYGDTVYAEDVPYGYNVENAWYIGESEEEGTVVTFPYTVTGDVVMKAIKEADVFNAVFDAGEGRFADGEKVKTVPTVSGAEIEVPAAPIREGYTFLMWSPEPGIIDGEDQYFTAVYEINKTTITFADTGDTTIAPITGNYGSPVTAEIPTPKKKGHTFAGWNTQIPTTMPAEDMTISALWTKNTYSVTFVDYDGSIISVVTGLYESDVTAPELPTEAGYTYKWDKEVPAKMPAENTTVTAVRTAHEYSISFDTNGGVPATIAPIENVECGSPITKPADPIKEGATFGGWADVSAPTTPITFPETMPAGGLNLIAIWNDNFHNATFDAAGGTFTGGTSVKVVNNIKYGDSITVPENPTRAGYIFNGWNPVPDKMLDEDMTFTAQWKPDASGSVEYKINVVTINPNDNSEITQTVVTNLASDGETVAVINKGETSTADHVYTFEEIIDSVSNVLDEERTTVTEMEVKLGEDNVLTVYCKLADVTVTFLANGGKFADGKQSVEVTGKYGSAITAPADPEMTGHKFTGWDKTVEGATFTTADVYLATWEAETYYAIFNINGEEYAKVPYKYGEKITAPEYKAEDGKTFSGWNVPANTTMGAGDMTFDATLTTNEYTLTYTFSTAPSVDLPAAVTGLNLGSKVTLADAEDVAGYTFNGWTYDGKTYAEGDEFTMPDSNVTVVGSYTAINYDVTYNTGDESVTVPADAVTSATVGTTIKLPEISRPGYTFGGWKYDGATYSANALFTMPAGAVEFEAVWDEIPAEPGEYTVSYSWTGDIPAGVTLPETQTEKEGDQVDVADVPTAEGYTFEGWKYEGKVTASFLMPAENVVLTGEWTKNAVPGEYTVSYSWTGDIPSSAVLPGSSTVKEGTEVDVADVPSADGYKFSGWYYNNEITESFVMPKNNVELKGEWTKLYKITLDATGGVFADGSTEYEAEFEAGKTVLVPAGPTRDGYKFAGWVDAQGNAASLPGTMPTEPVELFAAWDELYDVTFVVDGVEYEVVTDAGVAGDALPTPTKGEPTKADHIFSGWVDSQGNAVTVLPDSDITVTASWTKIVPDTYTIKYYDGSVLLKTEQYAVNADIADFAPDAKEGYTFKGWTDMPEDGKMPAKDLVVHAEWEANKNDITLDAGEGKFADGSSVFTETDVEYNSPLSGIVPLEPTREGYEFKGWVDANDNPVEIPAKMPDAPIDYTAKWEIKTIKVTFDAGEGKFDDGSSTAETSGDYDTDITLPEEPTREGFEFDGWDGLPEDGKLPAEDIKVTAKWKPVVKTYTLTIDAAGGLIDGQEKIVKVLAEGESIAEVSEPTREGYVFKGWDKDIPDTMPGNDLTITATWEAEETPTHTVTYYLAKGAEVYATKTFEEGETMVHPEPVAEGVVFDGWVDENGNPLPEKMGDKDIVAYAKIDHFKSYKATYIVEGETYAEYDVTYGSAITVPTDPTRPGYVFAGWADENGNSVASTMPAKDVTYTALWEEAPVPGEKFIVRYVVDGKTHDLHVLEQGDKIPVPADPTKFGYVFVGWEPEVPSTMPAEDLEFVAQWEVDKTFVAVVIGGTVISGAIVGAAIGTNVALITGASIIGGILVIIGVAELVKHTHTVTFLVDGEVYKTYKVVEGTKIPVPADPTKDGMKFDGWNPEIPDRMGNEDLVFEATWASNSGDAIVDVVIPDTGSAAGLAAFAVISGAAAAAYVLTNRKKKDEE